MFERGTIRPQLQTFMGKHHIHHFYGGFAARGIQTLKALRATPLTEIISICGGMKMPRPAIDRLLEVSGIRKKRGAKSNPPASNQSTKNDKCPNVIKKEKDTRNSSNERAGDLSENKDKTKTGMSTYYHFASTPADQAEKFQPKKITNTEASSKQFNSAIGASKWNPGNTFEDRDYTKLANEKWQNMMKDFRWQGSELRVVSFPKLQMDFSIICTRNKIKYIYDMAFTIKWKGKIGGERASGKLEMWDIMPDVDPDDWEWNVKLKKNDAAHQMAKMVIESSREIITANLKLLIAQFKEKGG